MPIIKDLTTPNGAAVGFHKARAGTVDYAAGTAMVNVSSWPTEAAHNAGLGLAWNWPVAVPISRMADVEAALLEIEGSPFLGGVIAIDGSLSLANMRARKVGELKQTRDLLIFGGLTWGEYSFDCDQRSQSVLMGLYVDSQQPGFEPQPWRLADNSWVVLDAAAAGSVWAALRAHIKTQFYTFAVCEAMVNAAEDLAAVEAVQWPE